MSVAADLASLRAVVGTGPADSELASLLTMHNHSVQAALNAYYEAPSPAVCAPAPAAPSNDCDTWPADQLERIFDRFHRVPTGDRHDVKGFGLGLHYVRSIVEGHGGSICCAQREGGGTLFTLYLPERRS